MSRPELNNYLRRWNLRLINSLQTDISIIYTHFTDCTSINIASTLFDIKYLSQSGMELHKYVFCFTEIK